MSKSEHAPGSAARAHARYRGDEARSDLDGDGREDFVFLLTLESGGSGRCELDGSELRLSVMAASRMLRRGAQESESTTMLGEASACR